MKTKLSFICILVILIALCAIFYFYKNPVPEQSSARQKCPEDYAETAAGITEYRNALINWTSLYFEANPKATMSDWVQAKTQLWLNNKCAVAIERSKISGAVADLKPWERIDYEVQNTIVNAINAPN